MLPGGAIVPLGHDGKEKGGKLGSTADSVGGFRKKMPNKGL